MIELDIPDPPDAETSVAIYRDNWVLPYYLIWDKHYQVPVSQFETTESLQRYFDNWFVAQEWVEVDDNVMLNATSRCSSARLTEGALDDSKLTVYTSREWLQKPAMKAPMQACLIIETNVKSDFYDVRLITFQPSLLNELNQ